MCLSKSPLLHMINLVADSPAYRILLFRRHRLGEPHPEVGEQPQREENPFEGGLMYVCQLC